MSYGEIRIIGGNWRGRKFKVPEVPDLRPTPDRVRETLFNWLAPSITGAHCLDPFAGSGALAFEALSRGAKEVVMVDQSLKSVQHLQTELQRFRSEKGVVYQATVPDGLKIPSELFDIVFLDPPYQQNLLLPTCVFLEEKNFLAADALIYLEAKVVLTEKDLPQNWKILKSKQAGQVMYHLAQRHL